MKRIEDLTNPAVLLKRLLYWRMAFFGLVILLAGMAIGAGMTLMTTRAGSSEPLPALSVDRIMRGLRYQLDLTDPQVREIRPMVRTCMEELDKIRREARPQINQELHHLGDGIASVLDNTQAARWKACQKRLMEQFNGGRIQRPAQRLGAARQVKKQAGMDPNVRPAQ